MDNSKSIGGIARAGNRPLAARARLDAEGAFYDPPPGTDDVAAANERRPLCVSVKSAAEMLGCSEWQVRRWIDEGLIAVVRFPSGRYRGELSRRVLLSVDDLKTFRDQHRVKTHIPDEALSAAARKGWQSKPVRASRPRAR